MRREKEGKKREMKETKKEMEFMIDLRIERKRRKRLEEKEEREVLKNRHVEEKRVKMENKTNLAFAKMNLSGVGAFEINAAAVRCF